MPKPVDTFLQWLAGRAKADATKGHKARAGKLRRAGRRIRTLFPVPKVTPTPTPPAPRGFMPGAIVENIPPGSSDPAISPCGVIYHVAVSTSPDLHDFFNGPSGGIESHFYVEFDGTIRQYRSIFFQADAQFAGNGPFNGDQGFVSIETEGMGDGKWTDAQLASLKAITLWVKSQRDFPLRVCPAWDAAGVGYHSLFTQWNTSAHSCPGPARIVQFQQVIVPWLKAGGK